MNKNNTSDNKNKTKKGILIYYLFKRNNKIPKHQAWKKINEILEN